jgi:hypothetical protein
MSHFNRGEYRACVEPLEVLFFADRNTFYQGLLHLVVALLQTRLGMIRGPRIRFASAAALLRPYAPWHRGLDVSGLLAFIQECLARLPEGVVQFTPAEVETPALPVFRLELTGRPQEHEEASGNWGDAGTASCSCSIASRYEHE